MQANKHILFISSWYPNRTNTLHGIFNNYFAQASALNNTVSVVHVCSDENLKQEYEVCQFLDENIATVIIYYKKITSKIPIVSNLLKFRKLIKAYQIGYEIICKHISKPNLIQLNVVMPAGIGALHLAQKHNIPFIITENWTGYSADDGSYKGMLLKYFTKKIVSKAKAILVVSEFLKNAMLSHNLNGNYHLISNVVNTNLFKPITIQKNEKINFIHISVLNDAQKNVSGIINAFSQALKTNNKLTLTIVGDGEDAELLKKLVTNLKLNCAVLFTGKLINEQLVNKINESDALIMFSNYETFGLVIAECLACGKPVISSNVGPVVEYLNRDLGVIIEKKNEMQLTQAMLNFTQDKFNSNVIREFAVSNFSKQAVSKKFDVIYNTILKNK